MALIVEDGTGKTDAESYLSVADADTYHSKHRAPASWTAADEAAKERALRLATLHMDTNYKPRWIGLRSSEDQALDWPREDVWIDRVYYESSELPVQLLNATAEFASKVTDGDDLMTDQADAAAVSERSARVAVISETIKYVGGSVGRKRYTFAEQLLEPLLEPMNAPAKRM
jgi:hypothetical protein